MVKIDLKYNTANLQVIKITILSLKIKIFKMFKREKGNLKAFSKLLLLRS